MADQDRSTEDAMTATFTEDYGATECNALHECINALSPLAASDPEAIERIFTYLNSRFNFSLEQVRKARRERQDG